MRNQDRAHALPCNLPLFLTAEGSVGEAPLRLAFMTGADLLETPRASGRAPDRAPLEYPPSNPRVSLKPQARHPSRI